ncbi:hypothetical protein Lser_V15G00843 [Lactuca serriola]
MTVNRLLQIYKKIDDRKIDNGEASDLSQKTKFSWAKEGDENSKMFHGLLKRRRRQMAVCGILIDGVWNTHPSSVKNEFFNSFCEKLKEVHCLVFELRSSRFSCVSPEQMEELDKIFCEQEIKQAMWDCVVDKAPDPDRCNFYFIKRFWDYLKDDVFSYTSDLSIRKYIPPGFNSSFTTLIPKVKDPILVNDFRPISLIGIIFKIIAKTLAIVLLRWWVL